MKLIKILLREGLINEVNYPLSDPPQYGDTDYKVRNGKIVSMNPKIYLGLVPKLDISDEESLENIDDLANMMNQGKDLDPPTLYLDGTQVVNHDGRHRAYAAIKLGMDKVPVLLLDINNNRISNTSFKPQLKEVVINETNNVWYHGTPDVRGLEKDGGFSKRTLDAQYIDDMEVYHKIQTGLKVARESGDDNEYHRLLDMVPKLKKTFTIRKPIFVTDKYNVAKTYADASRSFDYQNAEEKVLEVRVKSGKGVTITATGDRFRFIDLGKVKRGFIAAGVSDADFDAVFDKFNFNMRDKTKIKTDSIAIIGEYFGFDYIDVVGVLDSYEGGSTKSTVRMVFNPKDITINK